MNFICDLLPRNWLPRIFALEADPNVVPSSRQPGIGRCRSNLEWRELGDWDRTSSTLVRRSRTVGLGGASVVLTLVTNSKLVGCISGRSAGFASKSGRLQIGNSQQAQSRSLAVVPGAYKKPPTRRVIALALDSFDRRKAR